MVTFLNDNGGKVPAEPNSISIMDIPTKVSVPVKKNAGKPKLKRAHDKAFILGNGNSRPKSVNWLDSLKGITYGCNALYRDWQPSHLIVNDWSMMTEIVRSTYRGQCHFTDFTPLPIDSFESMGSMIGFNLSNTRYHGIRDGATDFVFMGDEAKNQFHIIWISVSHLNHIKWGMKPKYFGMSTGLCALQLALENEHEEITMYGFDGLKYKDYKNIYDGTLHYTFDPRVKDKKRIPETYVPLEADKWSEIYTRLCNDYPNVKINLL